MSAEPESVKRIVERLKGLGNGQQSDADTILKIYGDFRWSLKKAGMIGHVSYKDIEVLLEAAIKRVEKQVKDPLMRENALKQFTQAKNKLADWIDDETLRQDVCPTCQLPKFICPCPKENP